MIGIRRRSGGRHRARRRAAGVGLVLAIALAGSAGARAAIPDLSGLARSASSGSVPHDTGRVLQVDVPAPGLHLMHTRTFVYLPPGYATSTARHGYPVLYLLHGFPGRVRDWFAEGDAARTELRLLARHRIRPVILVAPTINNGSRRDFECLDVPHGPQLETFLTSALPAYMSRHFRVATGRSATGIGGFSAGADCALDLGLRHLTHYSVIVADTPSGEPGSGALRNALGGDRRAYDAHAPYLYLPAMTINRPLAVFLHSGTANARDDARVRLLAAELHRPGVRSVLVWDRRGRHDWAEVRAGFPAELLFAAQALRAG